MVKVFMHMHTLIQSKNGYMNKAHIQEELTVSKLAMANYICAKQKYIIIMTKHEQKRQKTIHTQTVHKNKNNNTEKVKSPIPICKTSE